MRKLSLALQSKENTTAVKISGFIVQCMETYQSMYDHLKDSPDSSFQLKHFAKIKENLIDAYQGVKLPTVESAMNALPRQAQSYIENILKALRERFEDEDSILKYACQILDMNTWHFSDDAPVRDMLEKHFIAINNIFQQFKDPLVKAGGVVEAEDYTSEYFNFVKYATTYLKLEKMTTLDVWNLMLQTPKCKTIWKNISLIIELLLIIPLSNADLERFFPTWVLLKMTGEVF